MNRAHSLLSSLSYPRSLSSLTERQRLALALAGVALLTLALRVAFLGRSYEVLVDEISYLRLAESVATSQSVSLYGEPFYLHPPGFFYLEAGYLLLLRPAGNLIEQIYAVRYLNVLFGAATAVVLFLTVRRLAGWRPALAATLVFALDPFAVRMNSINYLETTALWWVLAGYALLLPVTGRAEEPAAAPGGAETPPRPAATLDGADVARALAAGLLFGLGLLTKDMSAFLTLGPMIVCLLWERALPRPAALIAAVTTGLVYMPYPVFVFAAGHGPIFAEDKLRGLLRLLGLIQETGFNRMGNDFLISNVIARASTFGTTYAILALGVPAVAVLLLRGRAAERLVGLWAGSAYALLAYAIAFGTLEEQFFYFLFVPVLVALPVAAALAWRTDLLRSPGLRRAYQPAIAALLVLFTVWSMIQWARVHLVPNNGYEQALDYLELNVTAGSRVAATSETAQFILADQYGTGPWGSWVTVEELSRYRPDYVLVSTSQMAWDHGAAAEPLIAWIDAIGTPVFTFRGQAAGDAPLILYRMPLDW
jgi:hypothetical protein